MVRDGLKMEAGAARPVAQCRPIKPDALALIDLGLTIKRRVVAKLGDDHVRDSRFGRQPAGHDVLRCVRLHDGARAPATDVFRAARDQHAPLRRDHVKALADVCHSDGNLAASIASGISLASLLPIFSLAPEGAQVDDSPISRAIIGILGTFDLEPKIVPLLSLLVCGFIAKSLLTLLAMTAIPPILFLAGTWVALKLRNTLAAVLNLVGLGLHALWLLGGLSWLFG